MNGRRINMQEFKDATAMAQAVRNGEVSSVELVQDALFKVKQLNPTLNAVVHLQEERAVREAQSRNFSDQPFAGVPLLLKDLYNIMFNFSYKNKNIVDNNKVIDKQI